MREPVNHYRKALAAPNGPEYAEQYGPKAAHAAEQCRQAAIAGDMPRLRLHAISLSLVTQGGAA